MEQLDAVVVGAGHSGLAASRRLADVGIDHAVLERGRVGETWRTQRWESFRLNTPNWMNRLPGDEDSPPGPRDEFQSAPAFADRLAGYAARHGMAVRERSRVVRVAPDGDRLLVEVEATDGDGPPRRLSARSVVVASGIQNVPRTPAFGASLPARLARLHTLDYRRPGDLPDGAVLVVGSGQTGVQVAEDLLDAGRRVLLSVSRVARCPRRHRGQDMLEPLVAGGVYDQRLASLPDPAARFDRQPIISGTGPGGHTVSLQSLAARGVTLVGRVVAVEGETLRLDDTVGDCIRFGDAGSVRFRRLADDAILASGAALPPLEDDPADAPHPDPDGVHSPERLDLRREGVGTVIWATGVRGAFDWLPAKALDGDGAPAHVAGVTPVPGLFMLGLPWLVRRGSGIIYGIGEDAAMVAGLVAARGR